MQLSIKYFHPKYLLTWLGLFVLLLISFLPTGLRHHLANFLSKIAYKYNYKRRHIIIVNLSQCFPEFSETKILQLTKQNFFYTMLGYVEYSIAIFATKNRLKKLTKIAQPEVLQNLQQQNTGVLMLVAHTPLLELFGVALSGFVVGDYYHKTKNPVANYVIYKTRKRFVPILISRECGIGKIISPLKQGKMFYYPADEDLGEQYSVFAPFFKSTKATLTTPARISKITNCQCLPAIMVWDKSCKKYIVKTGDILQDFPNDDSSYNATQINQALEKLITQNIEQYMWSFKIFRTRKKDDPKLY